MSRKVRRITVSGYKSIRKGELDLGPVTVLVGPNGAGKSNFIEAVELLGCISDEELAMEVGLRGGAVVMMHDEAKGATGIGLRVEADDGDLANAYEAYLVPSRRGGLVFAREAVEFHDTGRYQQPMRQEIGPGHSESRLAEVADASCVRFVP